MSDLAHKLATLPTTPGVYLFKNAKGGVLYVGKAKSLRNRVRSYFRPHAALDPAKQQMIPKITDLITITCDNETEALILEATLIRRHLPPYNVILRDDKFYLFIKITTQEEYPRVFPVRRLKKDGARYFGPYSSAASVRNTLYLLRRIFPYKGEKESPREKIFPHPLFSDGRSRPAKERLPAEALAEAGAAGEASDVSRQREQYRQNIANIIRFLKGHRQEIITTLQRGMQQAATNREFERAAIFRDQLRAIERLEGNQKVFLPRPESFDVISLARRGNLGAANVFSLRGGKLLNKNTFLLKHRRTASPIDVLRQFLLQYYQVAQDIPATILVPQPLPDQAAIAQWINAAAPPLFTVPRRGRKRQLLALGELNAQQTLNQEQAVFETAAQAQQAQTELFTALGVTPAPQSAGQIETYDISNIQGRLATGSMVVFVKGLPAKTQYKKFRIRTQDTPNDYAMLQEVLRRRFAGTHDWPMPDLVIVDGGKGQLAAAQKVLDSLQLSSSLAALAKREETLLSEGKEIQLPYDSPALYLLQRMRDEAHRFTVSYHRLLRSKQQRRSLLDEVPGIGPQTKKKLLNHFGSLAAIRAASEEDINALIGPAKAAVLRDYL